MTEPFNRVPYTKYENGRLGPPSGLVSPRFAGPLTFGRLPTPDDVPNWDVTVLGMPFDGGTSYRPGARFGPEGIRLGSKLARDWNPHQAVAPFEQQQVVDAGDIPLSNFIIDDFLVQAHEGARAALEAAPRLVVMGGDHTVSFPVLRAMNEVHGPVALVHFDAHLDTWDTYQNAPYTHGTPFRRAHEEGLFIEGHSMHVGIRAPLYSPDDLRDDERMGFRTLGTWEIEEIGIQGMAAQISERVGDNPVYVSIDIDVLDPAFAPGTGTPEIGGFSTRELVGILRGLAGKQLVGADVVEVAPAYDHAEITTIAASNLMYELLSLMAQDQSRD